MKKSILYLLAGLALGFTACDDKSDLGTMQVNPQEPIVSTEGWAVNLVSGLTSGSTINLDQYADALDTFIPLVTVTTPTDLPSETEVSVIMSVAENTQFFTFVNVPLIEEDGTFGILAQDWEDAFLSIYGKAPDTKENAVRFAVYVTLGSQISRVGDATNYFLPTSFQVKPVDLGMNIEAKYYLYISNYGDGTLASAIEMSNSGVSQYDDPNFSVAVEIPESASGFQWYIIPESAYERAMQESTPIIPGEGWYWAEDPALLNGILVDVESGVSAAGTSYLAGEYLFAVNMYPGPDMAPTYFISLAVATLYTPGEGNNKTYTSGLLSSNDFVNYSGFTCLQKGFHLTSQANTRGMVWGQTTTEDNGMFELQQAGQTLENIYAPETKGLYWLSVNIGSLKYTYQYCETVSVIGIGGDWETDIELEPTTTTGGQAYMVWTGTVDFTEDTTGWKFRTNNGWDTPSLGYSNLEDPYSDLVQGAENNLPMPSDGPGTYTVTLNLRKAPYFCTLVKQ